MWLALEALFGPEDGRNLTRQLSARISAFLAADLGQTRAAVQDQVRHAYSLRGDVVHGRAVGDEHVAMPGMSEANSERWARVALCKVLGDLALTDTFSDEEKRDDYLDGLVLDG